MASSSGTSCGKLKTGRPNERGIILNVHEKATYKTLLNRGIALNRYPDPHALKALGIRNNVMSLIRNIGWIELIGQPHYTFTTLTLEFLSTLYFVQDKANARNPEYSVSFCLGNMQYNMSLIEFYHRMGFPSTGLIHTSRNKHRLVNYDQQEFWSQITGRDHYDSRTAKASMIHNPVFRYVHRVIACTIFGRPETATVRTDELFIIWAMVTKSVVNTGYYLLRHLASVAAASKGKIVVGGLISFISWKMGGHFATQEGGLDGNYLIDLAFCQNIHMIRAIEGSTKNFQYLIFGEDSILLPNPSRTDTTNVDNWLYHSAPPQEPQEHHAQDEEMGDNQEEQQPAEGMKYLTDWRHILETKIDKANDEAAVIKQMLASTNADVAELKQMLGSKNGEVAELKQMLLTIIDGWAIKYPLDAPL